MLVLYSSGRFIRWDIGTQKKLEEFFFSATDRKSSSFSENGSLLVTAGDIIHEGDDEGDKGGYQVWDTANGILLECYASPICRSGNSSLSDFPIEGLIVVPNGKLLVSYHNSSVGITPLKENYGTPSNYTFSGFAILRQVRVSPSGKYIAFIRSDGEVTVQEFGKFANIDIDTGNKISNESPREEYVNQLGFTMPNELTAVYDLAFDQGNEWLATLTDKELAVWNLQKSLFSSHLDIPIVNGNMLAFDRMGNLLALATDEGVSIIDVATGNRLVEFNVGNVTYIYFTRDNRLLVWGDTQGTIHLWGVK